MTDVNCLGKIVFDEVYGVKFYLVMFYFNFFFFSVWKIMINCDLRVKAFWQHTEMGKYEGVLDLPFDFNSVYEYKKASI